MRLILTWSAIRAAQISMAAVWLSFKAQDLSQALWTFAEQQMAHAGSLADEARLHPVPVRRR